MNERTCDNCGWNISEDEIVECTNPAEICYDNHWKPKENKIKIQMGAIAERGRMNTELHKRRASNPAMMQVMYDIMEIIIDARDHGDKFETPFEALLALDSEVWEYYKKADPEELEKKHEEVFRNLLGGL